MAGADETAERFDNRPAQIAIGAFGALLVVIGLAGLSTSEGWSALYLIAGALTIARGVRSSSVVVDSTGVTTRSIVRTRRRVWDDLDGIEVAVGRTGLNGFGREHLVFHRRDGQVMRFTGLNSAPPKDQEGTSVVRRAAACINEGLDEASPT